jgi:hypothetical protein
MIRDFEDGFHMTESEQSRPGFQINTRAVIGGAVLIGIGGVLGLAGAALAGSAFFAAARRRVQQMEVPPSELARQNWARAKAATAAGVTAWRNGQPAGEAQRA